MKEDLGIVILTGAGISAESGIRTFRAADGLWENHRIEDVAGADPPGRGALAGANDRRHTLVPQNPCAVVARTAARGCSRRSRVRR